VRNNFRALLVGVCDYDDRNIENLPFIAGDLADLKAALEGVGYQVTLQDPARDSAGRIRTDIARFLRDAGRGDNVLIVLSGHGVHRNGRDYLVTAEAATDAEDFTEDCLEIDFGREIQPSEAGSLIVVVDACREGIHLQEKGVSSTASWSVRQVEKASGRTIAYVYACGRGERAQFVRDSFSLFSRAIAQVLTSENPPDEINRFFDQVQVAVDRIKREHGISGRQRLRIRAELAGVPVLIHGAGTTSLTPDYYAATLIRQYENFDTVSGRREPPIVEAISRSDLFDVFVPLNCVDSRGEVHELDKYVRDWLANGGGDEPLVLLGEYGYGKTSYCLNLTYHLLRKWQQDPQNVHLPIFLSFRDLVPTDEHNAAEKALSVIRDRFRLIQEDADFSVALRDRRTLLILDGLDEIEKSLEIEWIRRKFQSMRSVTQYFSKVIVTCRVSYLSDAEDVRHVISKESHQQIVGTVSPGSDLDIVTLQSFDTTQKVEYVNQAVDDPVRRRQLLKAIAHVKDLPDLTTRPVLLWMVVTAFRDNVVDLDGLERVGAAQLYERFTRQWLDIELDKERVGRDIENQDLMHRIALKIDHDPSEQIHRDELRRELRISFPDRSEEAIGRLEHEFLVCSFFRPSQLNHFAFVHRSFLEFFVAKAYWRYITEDRPEAFARELLKPGLVIDFLGQLILSERPDKAQEQLRHWLTHAPDIISGESRLAANAATVLCRTGFRFQGMDLSGVDLRDADLTDGDLREVDLRQARLENVRLDGTLLRYSDLRFADLANILIRRADFKGADLRGTRIKNIRIIGGPDTVWIALFSPDQKHIVIGTDHGYILVLDNHPPYPEVTRHLLHETCVLNLTFDRTGTRLAATNRHREIYIFDWPSLLSGTPDPPVIFDDNANYVRWVEFSPDGSQLASGARDLLVKIWYLGTNLQVANLRFHRRDVMSVCWSPDGRYLASGGYDGTIALWDTQAERITPVDLRDRVLMARLGDSERMDGRSHDNLIRALVFSPDGVRLASSSEDDTIKVWDLDDPQHPTLDATIVTEYDVFCLKFVNDGAALLAGDAGGYLMKIDIEDRTIMQRVRAHGSRMRSLDLSADQQTLLSSAWDGTVKTWNVSDLSPVSTVFQLDTGAVAYEPRDAFLDTQIAGIRELEEQFRTFFIAMGAVESDDLPGPTPIRPKGEPAMTTSEAATDTLFAAPTMVSRDELQTVLCDLLRQPWYSSAFVALEPGVVPDGYAHRELLSEIGLIDGTGRVRYGLNAVGGLVFLTDGPWNPHGVFPFPDESELLLRHCARPGFGEFDYVVDPGAGCGSTPLAYPDSVDRPALDRAALDRPTLDRAALDIDPRAAQFQRLNAWLNGRTIEADYNDIMRGFPSWLAPGRKYLFLANMPFAISPYAGALSHVRDGGESGIRLSSAVLNAALPYVGTGSRLVILTYSLSRGGQEWQFVERARQILPNCEQRWTLTPGNMWRVGLEKVEPNPMPITALNRKAANPQRTADERHRLRAAYDRLAKELTSLGWDTLGCGILEIDL
jgi:WD40 repeat protein